jgi:hypothetical protein
MYNEFDVSIVLAYETSAKPEAEVLAILPEFTPLRGAKSAEKIAEQMADHQANWLVGAASRPHTAVVTDAYAISHTYNSREVYRVQSTEDVRNMLLSVEESRRKANRSRGMIGCLKPRVRWLGVNTKLAVKLWQFEFMRAGWLSQTASPELPNTYFYGAQHFDLLSALEISAANDVSAIAQRVLPPDRWELAADASQDMIVRQAVLAEEVFSALGELRGSSEELADASKASSKKAAGKKNRQAAQ